ncbi:MAG: DUF2283 domain-containing protein [Alphaproteobacteria bacterium]|nr:DUF2283 domain-containing protein [Alphaproteobacteria bacterium]
MIRTNYDPEADVLHVQFGPEGAKYDGAEEVAPGVFVEFDAAGNPIGVEVISVRKRATIGQFVKPAAE